MNGLCHRLCFGIAKALLANQLSVMGAFGQFERELIRERQRECIEVAKKAGAYRVRKHSLTFGAAAELRLRLGKGENNSLAREFGVDRTTVYRYAKSTSGGRAYFILAWPR